MRFKHFRNPGTSGRRAILRTLLAGAGLLAALCLCPVARAIDGGREILNQQTILLHDVDDYYSQVLAQFGALNTSFAVDPLQPLNGTSRDALTSQALSDLALAMADIANFNSQDIYLSSMFSVSTGVNVSQEPGTFWVGDIDDPANIVVVTGQLNIITTETTTGEAALRVESDRGFGWRTTAAATALQRSGRRQHVDAAGRQPRIFNVAAPQTQELNRSVKRHLSRPAATLSSAASGGEGWGEEVLRFTETLRRAAQNPHAGGVRSPSSNRLLSDGLDHFLRRIRHRVAGDERQAGVSQSFLAGHDVVAFEADDEREFQSGFPHRGDDAGGDDVAIHDAAENVHQNAFHVRIAQNDFESRRDLFLARAAADVEKVRRACRRNAG